MASEIDKTHHISLSIRESIDFELEIHYLTSIKSLPSKSVKLSANLLMWHSHTLNLYPKPCRKGPWEREKVE